ncbi:class I histocompatibility antigen, F10 alpha chain-like isoform X3 [Eleutherodactylus coqui]|uniref:class I histocompatibility antigen, F10 alpha chain-like isoform X3 n=1 Tax=Eleutherodactylus coqui TaxID=57060 RepID=UPI003462F1EA
MERCRDSHSLYLHYMGVSAPGSGLPIFVKAAYVDDQQIWAYSSNTGRAVPVAPWLKKNTDPEYWEGETIIAKGAEALYKYEVKLGMKRFNHTKGLHFVQVFNGCELRDDGSTAGYELYRYDGGEYMYLDIKTATFIPTSAPAQIITQRWNSPDVKMGERTKYYLEDVCIRSLKIFLEYGREDLERRVQPRVKVMGRESGEVTKLHCLAYGFYPRAVDVKWMKNRADEVPTYQTTHVIPNPDGTYQIRVSVEVIPQEGDSYSCYVDHSSLEEPLLVDWDPEQEVPLSVIISVGVISVLVLIAVVVGVVIYRRKKDDHTADGDHAMREVAEFPSNRSHVQSILLPAAVTESRNADVNTDLSLGILSVRETK